MGLDVVFNRQQALDAGLVTKVVRNGTDADVAEARQDEERGEIGAQPGYADWLASSTLMVQVPGTNFWVPDDGIEVQFVLRARKSTGVYLPLTQWLKSKGIAWSEEL